MERSPELVVKKQLRPPHDVYYTSPFRAPVARPLPSPKADFGFLILSNLRVADTDGVPVARRQRCLGISRPVVPAFVIASGQNPFILVLWPQAAPSRFARKVNRRGQELMLVKVSIDSGLP